MPPDLCSVQPECRSGTVPTPEAARIMPKLESHLAHSPVVVKQLEKRGADFQLRIADAITAFAGSMMFVYIHIGAFAVWMLLVERSPWPTLTLVVSLEAIFLSTFVMIGQNRQSAFQQEKADHDYAEEERLLQENTDLTRMIHALTQDVHQTVCGSGAGATE
jgi:uncharacterized membrane protein